MFGREVVVRSVDEEVQNQLERLSLGLPPVENRSVSSVANVDGSYKSFKKRTQKNSGLVSCYWIAEPMSTWRINFMAKLLSCGLLSADKSDYCWTEELMSTK